VGDNWDSETKGCNDKEIISRGFSALG